MTKKDKKHFLIFFGHPAQFLFLKNSIHILKNEGYKFTLIIKRKDVLEDLIQAEGFEYIKISDSKRKLNKVYSSIQFIKRILNILFITLKKRPDLLISTDASTAIIGKWLGINRITILEDDYEFIKLLADLAYPSTQTILCPTLCDVGPYEDKKIGYQGYMKLSNLHPEYFINDKTVVEKYNLKIPYIIIRLAELSAYHDTGIKGLTEDIVDDLISKAKLKGYNIYMSIEGDIPEKYQKFLLNIRPKDFHSVLANTELLISDSQSMSVEASILGVPSLRFNSFAGKISILEELEHIYKLTKGINVDEVDKLKSEFEQLLSQPNRKEIFNNRKEKMLEEKINVTKFLNWFLTNYPKSKKIMQETPNYQFNFK